MKKQIYFSLILAVFAVSLLAAQAPALAVSSDTLDLELSYSSVEKTEFTGEYWFVDQFGAGLYYEDERYYTSVLFQPVKDLKMKLGYDLTAESYWAGVDHLGRIGENLVVDSEIKRFWPDSGRKGEVDYWEYKTQLDIGIGGRNIISPGIEGYYSPENKPDPELFIHFDINWGFGNGFNLKFEPHVLVVGDFEHRITLSKDFENDLSTEIFAGQDREGEWEFGAVLSY